MTISDLYTELKKIGLPVVYHHWEIGKAPEPPYLVYYEDGTDDFYADNINYMCIKEMTVELYTGKKDLEIEEKIERFFEEHEITYDSFGTWIDTESMYEKAYTFSII